MSNHSQFEIVEMKKSMVVRAIAGEDCKSLATEYCAWLGSDDHYEIEMYADMFEDAAMQ